MSRLEPSAIIFDCDRTLVDSSVAYYRTFSEIVARRNAVMPEMWFRKRLGMSRREIFRQFQEEFGVLLDRPAMEEGFSSLFWPHLGEVRAIEPVAALARSRSGQLPIAVASGGARDIVEATLTAAGLLGLFDAVVTVDDPGMKGKPEPDLFLEAARRLAVRPADCLVFEDSDEGIEAARRAGMPFRDVRLMLHPA